jgi:hypothetical protein
MAFLKKSTETETQLYLFVGDREIETAYCRSDCVARYFVDEANTSGRSWPKDGWFHSEGCPCVAFGHLHIVLTLKSH